MRTKVRITHFAVLGCVFSYSVERPGENALNGKITMTELQALVDKVVRSEPVTLTQGLLVVLHQAHFNGLYSNLVHKHAMLDSTNNYLYVDGDRVCTESTGYGFLQRAEPDGLDDMITAREALAEQAADDAKKYQELREIMALNGWIQRSTGHWANFKTVIEDQPTMHDAIVACIMKGNGK